VLGNLGLAYADLGDARRAIELYEQALVIDREIGDRRGEGADRGNLGSAYLTLKDYERAVEYYRKQLAIVQEIGDRRGEGNALWGLAISFKAAQDAHQAIIHAQAALEIFIAIESPSAQTMRELLAKLAATDG
jgi:tetratricopeptide (TPR) repeat protein